jgi:hypothetical protein
LSYSQAIDCARRLVRGGDEVENANQPLTLKAALAAYEADLKARGANRYNAKWPLKYLPAALLSKPVPLIDAQELRRWRDSLLADHAPATVSSLLAPDAAIGVWVTNFILLEGLHIPLLAAWQLKPKALITWPKDYAGRGYWAKGQTEHFVIATRGKPTVTLSDQTTLLKGPFHLVRRGAHSAKPLEAYVYFESLCPAPRYFDLFSRYRHNERWDPWGFEAPPANGGDGGAGMVARTGGDSPP